MKTILYKNAFLTTLIGLLFYRNTPQLCCGWEQPTGRAITDEKT